jgi:hypothetical protein
MHWMCRNGSIQVRRPLFRFSLLAAGEFVDFRDRRIGSVARDPGSAMDGSGFWIRDSWIRGSVIKDR